MTLVVINSKEVPPMYYLADKPGWSGQFRNLPTEKKEWVDSVFAEFVKVQEYLRQQMNGGKQ